MYRDFDLEAEIYQLCSPYIANKIILEYLRAKDNNIYNVYQKNPSLFEVVYKNPTTGTKLVRRVNLQLHTCDCHRMTYFGFPCSHIICVLLKTESKVSLKLNSLILSRWKIGKKTKPAFPLEKSHFLKMEFFHTPQPKGKKKVTKTKKSSTLSQNQVNNNSKVNISQIESLAQSQPSIESVAPKKPMTAYFLYAQELRPEYKNKFPSKTYAEISKEIAKAYKVLNEEEKNVYEEKAQALKTKYDEDMKNYTEKFGKIEKKRKQSQNDKEKNLIKKKSKISQTKKAPSKFLLRKSFSF